MRLFIATKISTTFLRSQISEVILPLNFVSSQTLSQKKDNYSTIYLILSPFYFVPRNDIFLYLQII